MRALTPRAVLACVLTLSVLVVPTFALDVLLVDGQNNHDWRKTTPVLVAILEDAGFRVDVATTPKNLDEFRPDFSAYDVVVSNYNGAAWPEATRDAFVKFVRDGGGFVSVHAADNSFREWKEYNEMIAVGGWGGRNETDGPMLYWQDGAIVRDTSKGGGGSHGRQHAFRIIHRAEHPILRGLPQAWMHAQDELYSNLRGPAKDVTVLATAWSDPKTGGTGRHEPMLLVVPYGKGRAFHTTLGHHLEGMNCAGFVATLQRGTEWAATGEVTLPPPSVFPAEDRVVNWLPRDTFHTIRNFDFGGDRRPLSSIEEALRGADEALRARTERELIAALLDRETRYAGKQFAVRLLRQIGTEECVPALASLLANRELSHNARFALEALATPEATEALLRALPSSAGELRVGLVGSLGERGDDPRIVAALAPLLGEIDVSLRAAVLRALGRIGSLPAARVLAATRLDPPLSALRDDALLSCAERLARNGEPEPALAQYRALANDETRSALVRLAALRGRLRLDVDGSIDSILALLDADDRALREGASSMLTRSRDSRVARALATRLAGLESRQAKIVVLEALEAQGDPSTRNAVAACRTHPDRAVRLAAIAALGTVGNADDTRTLVALSRAEGEIAETAFASLTRLAPDGVRETLCELVAHPDTTMRRNAVRALAARREPESAPALLLAASDPALETRAVAVDALGEFAGPEHLAALARLSVTAVDPAEAAKLAGAVRRVAERLGSDAEKSEGLAAILAAASESDGPERTRLLSALAVIGTPTALAAAEARLASQDRAEALGALSALAAWPTSAPAETLLAIAKSDADEETRGIALRGYIRQVTGIADRPPPATVALLGEALQLAPSVDERRRVLQRVGEFPCREALALARSLEANEELAAVAKDVASRVESSLIESSIVLTASHGQDSVRNALDRDAGTRWSTGTPMRPGMWLLIDLGEAREVERLILDTRNSSGDYPRGCEVLVSLDGRSFGEPVLVSPPQRPITRLDLPDGTRARFVKIVQTGETQGLFWSIHELTVRFK